MSVLAIEPDIPPIIKDCQYLISTAFDFSFMGDTSRLEAHLLVEKGHMAASTILH